MRVVAPVEWNLGLPFPANAAMVPAVPVIELPEELSFSAWLESRVKVRQSALPYDIERPLAA